MTIRGLPPLSSPYEEPDCQQYLLRYFHKEELLFNVNHKKKEQGRHRVPLPHFVKGPS